MHLKSIKTIESKNKTAKETTKKKRGLDFNRAGATSIFFVYGELAVMPATRHQWGGVACVMVFLVVFASFILFGCSFLVVFAGFFGLWHV